MSLTDQEIDLLASAIASKLVPLLSPPEAIRQVENVPPVALVLEQKPEKRKPGRPRKSWLTR